jgi:predicted MPP superfamily phosphohydrolase
LRSASKLAVAAGAALAGGAAWSLYESQWVEFNELDVPVDRLPVELDGFRILHLSDFHLGTVSFNGRALRKATAWATAGRHALGGGEIDLVAVTGDLVSRRRGRQALEAALARLEPTHGVYAVLGNHDVAETRDPFAAPDGLTRLPQATLLFDEARTVEARGRRVQIVGVEPRAFVARRSRPQDLVDPDADLRILLCHYPDVIRRLPAGAFDLVLAGHLHGGQICVPSPWGKLRLEHVRADHWEGLHRTPVGMLYISRGLGTSFVPFRFLARPEVALLTLKTRGPT